MNKFDQMKQNEPEKSRKLRLLNIVFGRKMSGLSEVPLYFS